MKIELTEFEAQKVYACIMIQRNERYMENIRLKEETDRASIAKYDENTEVIRMLDSIAEKFLGEVR